MTRKSSRRSIFVLVVLLPLIAVMVVALRPDGIAAQPSDLAELIDSADKLVVLEQPGNESTVQFESSNRRDLDELKAAIRVNHPDEYMHCMCDGTPAIVLYAKGKAIGQITNHHAKLIRCSLWKSDAELMDAESFLKWFDARSIFGPRREFVTGLDRERESTEHDRKWVKAMPESLKPLWPEATQSFRPDITPLKEALAAQFTNPQDRILALFTWYGSGAGPWSGFPAYEDIAETLLLDYTTQELLAAVKGKDLTEAQTEGVARLFGGWTFSKRSPDDAKLLPAELKDRLLKHSLTSTDEDKRARAQNAFGNE